MSENDQTSKNCSKSEDGKHVWEATLHSPGHHGEKSLIEVFVCSACGIKKPIKKD